jgi:hypothetical protein
MSRRKDVVEVGDVYTNLELDLTYRVVEMREEDGESVVTVETLEEGVETYRTLDELEKMLEEGEVVESDVPLDAFDEVDDDTVPVESSVSEDTKKYLKVIAIVGVGLLLAGILVPVAGTLFAVAARFVIPAAILALAVYLLYTLLSDSTA